MSKYAVGIIHYRDNIAANTLIASMNRWTAKPSKIFVADNSRDFSQSEGPLRAVTETLDMGSNVGFGSAANALMGAARASGFTYLLLLTQDALLRFNAAESLENHVRQNRKVAVAAPYLMFSSKPQIVFSAGGILTGRGRTLHPDQGQSKLSIDVTRTKEVDWVDGACMMINLDAAREVNGFDPAYFLYVEEVDFHFRLRKIGYSVHVVGNCEANQEPGNYSLYYKYRNLLYFSRKNSPNLKAWPWVVALVKDGPKSVRKNRAEEVLWALLGVLHASRGKMGQKPTTFKIAFQRT